MTKTNPRKSEPAGVPALVPGESMTISMFCARHHMSRRSFYNLSPAERPRITRIGASQRISQVAEAEWVERLTDQVA